MKTTTKKREIWRAIFEVKRDCGITRMSVDPAMVVDLLDDAALCAQLKTELGERGSVSDLEGYLKTSQLKTIELRRELRLLKEGLTNILADDNKCWVDVAELLENTTIS